MAFPQVPARTGCWRGWAQPGEKGYEVRAAGVGRKAPAVWRRRKDSERTGVNGSPKTGGCRTAEGVAAQETQTAEGEEGRSACRLLGTWPAVSDVGRKTPESTSAKESVATQRPLCSPAPHPFHPLLSQFIYPCSKDSLTVPRGWLKWPGGGL